MTTELLPSSGHLSGDQSPNGAASCAQWLICRVGGEEYLLEVPLIKEIILLPELTAVPRSPRWLKGVCSLRGVVVAVIDVGSRLGLDECRITAKSRVIVLSTEKGMAGLFVDSVQGLCTLDARQVNAPPTLLAAAHREFLRGVVHLDGHAYAVLDIDRMMTFQSDARPGPC